MADKRRVIVIGSGPAGYTAALYLARAELKPLVLTGEKSGGQLMLTTKVENYPGFPNGKMGPELMMDMRKQAEKFGAQMVDKTATAVDFSVSPFKVWTFVPEGISPEDLAAKANKEEFKAAVEKVKQQPHAYEARSVVVVTGAIALFLEVPGELEYMGRGVSTCGVCDAAFFKDKNVYVVGGGDAAMEDTLSLTKFAASVTVIHRRNQLRASKIMQRRVLEDNKEKVKVLWDTEVLEVKGDGQKVTGLRIKNNKTNEEKEIAADGLFLSIGHKPLSQVFQGELELDEKNYVVTGIGLSVKGLGLAQKQVGEDELVKFPTMTSKEGVFAAGDVVDFRYRQAVTAAGFGCMAALDVERWLERAKM